MQAVTSVSLKFTKCGSVEKVRLHNQSIVVRERHSPFPKLYSIIGTSSWPEVRQQFGRIFIFKAESVTESRLAGRVHLKQKETSTSRNKNVLDVTDGNLVHNQTRLSCWKPKHQERSCFGWAVSLLVSNINF